MTTTESIPSVKTAVELEARRRKRVFAMFLALLLIPIAIGAYAIAKAPSETEILVQNASPIIEKNLEEKIAVRVDQNIEPRVDAIVARRAGPVIEQTLDKSIIARVQPIEENYRILARQGDTEHARSQAELNELRARVEALEKRLEALTSRPRPIDLQLERRVTDVPKPVPQ